MAVWFEADLGSVKRVLLPASLAAAVVVIRLCKSPQRAFGTSAPPHAGARPALFTRCRGASAAPSRRSDFRDVLSVAMAHILEVPPQGAPTAPQPASTCWARWLPSLRARSGPRQPTARRLFGSGSGPVSQPEIRAHRARRPGRRGAAERGSGKVRAGNLPRLRAPRAGAALAAPLRKRIPPLCPALVQLTNDRGNLVRRRQPRRKCPQRGAG